MWAKITKNVVKPVKDLTQKSSQIRVSMAKKSSLPSSATFQPKAVGLMLQHQHSLPRLPVPPLQSTLNKYLASVQPLLTKEEFEQTRKITEEFGAPGGFGEKLHAMLVERAANTENWLSEWWLHLAYLGFRMPVVVHSSPGLVFPAEKFASKDEYLKFTAKLIAAALNYRIMIEKQVFPPEMMGKSPLDMSQYFKIFATCRIPDLPVDRLVHHAEGPNPPRHIVVVHNNHYFKVDVFGDDGAPLNASQFLEQLKMVVQQSQHQKSPIGVLTTEQRDNWAKAYKRLCKDKLNKQSVKTIQQSLFLICLDKPMEVGNEVTRRTRAALQTIHGGGSQNNSGNRWFDKTLQFIVSEDGIVGLTYEHSPSEGPPIANLMDHIVKYIHETSGNQWLPSAGAHPPQKLKFNLSPETIDDIQQAEQELDVLVKDLEMTCFKFEGYGKSFIKSQKLSPDSFIQMAIQLAFYRTHNHLGATYESASTRKFLHGRTETIRSASNEALEFCQRMTDPTSTPAAKGGALRVAIEAHKKYVNDAVNGQGVDRVLTGFKQLCVENGMNIPEIFMDTGYTRSTHFLLSTSQVPAKSDAFMCYGPLVPDGYGCCYNPHDAFINFGVSACNSSPETHSSVFADALRSSLSDMHDVLLLSQKAKL